MWGQDIICYDDWDLTGIIPTRVGTRRVYLIWIMRTRDHPHACGDKTERIPGLRKAKGSSPRVWGQVPPAFIDLSGKRIIPTRVGTSLLIHRLRPLSRDHPHACGDKEAFELTVTNVLGSSPRVWGQDFSKSRSVTFVGIIPTRVGTSKIKRRDTAV